MKNAKSLYKILVIITILSIQAYQPSYGASNKLKLNFIADKILNTNRNSQASPLLVEIYQLSNLVTFEKADFFDLEEDAGQALGANLLHRDSIQIRPGQSITKEQDYISGVKYLAFVAAYQDISNATWQVAIDLKEIKGNKIDILLGSKAISIASDKKKSSQLNWKFFAFPALNLSPYLGLDMQWRNMPFEVDYGNDLFRTNSLQGNLFLGLKLNEYVGLEVGHEVANKKGASIFVNENVMHLGNTTEYSRREIGKRKVKGWNINLIATVPVLCKYPFEILGIIGIARLQTKEQVLKTTDWLSLYDEINFKATKNVLRGGGGAQMMLTNQLGIRATVLLENTEKFGTIRASSEAPQVVKLKNSYLYGIGMFVKF